MTPRELMRSLLDDSREEISRADSKASIVLAAAGVGMAAFLAGVVSGDWEPSEIENCVEWLWWVAATAFLLGVGALGRCIWPSTELRSQEQLPSYFDRIARYDDAASLRAALESVDPDEIFAEQLHSVACIAKKKYIWFRIGLSLLATGGTLMALVTLAQGACS